MLRQQIGLMLCLVTTLLASGNLLAAKEDPRNPFGVPDVPDSDGPDVQAFAKTITLPGDKEDANAASWVGRATAGTKGSLDGVWQERWNHHGSDGWHYSTKPTRIKTVEDRVYFLVAASNGRFLIDTKRNKNRLVGRYQGIDHPADTGPCVFLIVDDERIDGNWAGYGRWDFRRRLQSP